MDFLFNKESYIKQVVDAIPETFFICNNRCEMILVNEKTKKWIGFDPTGMNYIDLIAISNPGLAKEGWKRQIECRNIKKPIFSKDEKDGKFYESSIYPILNDDREVEFFACYSKNLNA